MRVSQSEEILLWLQLDGGGVAAQEEGFFIRDLEGLKLDELQVLRFHGGNAKIILAAALLVAALAGAPVAREHGAAVRVGGREGQRHVLLRDFVERQVQTEA